MEEQVAVRNLSEFEDAAGRFAASLHGSQERATLITLSGELGAGKTAFVQAVARSMGITEAVTSPTFVIEKTYAIPSDRAQEFSSLVHIDAYRLTEGKELSALGFEKTLATPHTLILIEWPEKVADILPPASATISFTPNAQGERICTIHTPAA